MNRFDLRREELSQIRKLRLMSTIEGSTLLVLVLIAVPARHLFGFPLLSKVLGPVHGLAFLAYIWTVIATVSDGNWSRAEIVRLIGAAFLPFGAYTNIGLLRRKEATLWRP